MPEKRHTKSGQAIRAHPAAAVNSWRFEQPADRPEINLCMEAGGAWLSIASVKGAAGIGAEALASHLVRVLNEDQQQTAAIEQVIHALEALIEEGVTWATEMEAEHSIRRLRQHPVALHEALNALDRIVEEGVTGATKKEAQRTVARLKDYKNKRQSIFTA